MSPSGGPVADFRPVVTEGWSMTEQAPNGRSRAEGDLHRSHRTGWLRAAVLGANDGLVSTASLIVGVAAADSSRSAILIAGFAGLTAGTLSMAAGEYVSVSSQRDAEHADLVSERAELVSNPEDELEELAQIYIGRGLSPELSHQVAVDLTAHDQLAAHARDEIGIDPNELARPIQAAVVSALSFVVGAIVPILAVAVASASTRIAATIVTTLVALGVLGLLGARVGGAPVPKAAARVLVGGALAMFASLIIGKLTGNFA
jgi:vacuolar iron transporter family protein